MRGFQPMAMRGKAKPFANGGPVRGPGTGTSDEVVDTVPNGTYIMPTDSTQAMGEQQLAAMGSAPRGFAPAKAAPEGRGVPVQLSNGEFKLPPEQVHAIGVQVLDQLKDATHTPVAGRGFVPKGKRAETGAGADNGQQGPVRGFSPIGQREAVPKTFQGEPPLFFADGGVVTRGLPARDRLRCLVDDGRLKRVLRGVYVPVELHPPARAMSKTVLPDGTVKVEIGEEVLTLTPKEDRTLAMLLAGSALSAINIASEMRLSEALMEVQHRLGAR